MTTKDEWLPVTEVARRIGASASTVRGLIRDQKLHAVRHTLGGKYVVRESECDRYLAELEAGTLAAPTELHPNITTASSPALPEPVVLGSQASAEAVEVHAA